MRVDNDVVLLLGLIIIRENKLLKYRYTTMELALMVAYY